MSNNFSLAFHGRRTLREILCALLAFSLAAGDAFAWQAPAGKDAEHDSANWEKVRDIGPDKEIQVETRAAGRDSAAGPTYRGHLRKWEPGGLVVQLRKGGDKEISKSLIQNVSLMEKCNRRKSALLGAAVGFGIGALIGANIKIADTNHPTAGDRMAGAVVVGGIWAGIGALIGRAAGGTKITPVYKAP
jgi:hypothetical protein